MIKTLLFGSNGFLGSHLQSKLDGEIIGVNIRHQNWQENIPGDANVFINCIGKAHDHKGTATEKDFYFANYELVKVIFEEFLKSNAQIFIHISSIAAVEENERKELLTEDSVGNPQSHYGKSKKAAEEYLLKQSLPSWKKLFILRPTMIHGEGDKGNLTLLYKIISKGIPYPLGAFDNSRTFVSVDNLVFLINKIFENRDSINSGIYNVADDEPVSTSNLIRIMAQVNQKNPLIVSVPKVVVTFLAKIGDTFKLPFNSKRLSKMTTTLLVSNQKIKTALKLKELPLSAEEGLIKTISSFKTQL
ncbi:NAD-dependent epimerase/dehydratase family protein [Chryseobacterium taklimakanense]|uniref:NAD-dependent epimerase/dehydratase family protein n=1 Tax=Chryseobacterium taklimakanense TaxID=536441 RepID=UPI0023F73D63|nr:NAD-dependent epimerase/dehydratase family protein [Chryseobacterium taklimakanense]